MALDSISSQFSKSQYFLFQPCFSNQDPSYLVYFAPEGESNGRFVQEEGGIVWFSEKFPEGETCDTVSIPRSLGDEILIRIFSKDKGVERNG